MMNLNNSVENHRKNIIILFVLIDLKREIEEDFVFALKAKTLMLNVLVKKKAFRLT